MIWFRVIKIWLSIMGSAILFTLLIFLLAGLVGCKVHLPQYADEQLVIMEETNVISGETTVWYRNGLYAVIETSHDKVIINGRTYYVNFAGASRYTKRWEGRLYNIKLETDRMLLHVYYEDKGFNGVLRGVDIAPPLPLHLLTYKVRKVR